MRTVVSTFPVRPSFATRASMRALSFLKSWFSLATSFFCSSWIELFAIAWSGVIAGSGGSVPGFSGCLSLPVSMTASPPERILPEKAS